jgi:hypothetical protein
MNPRLQESRSGRIETIMRQVTIAAVAAAFIVLAILVTGSDARARGAGGLGGRGMSSFVGHGHFGWRMRGTRFDGFGSHHMGRPEVGRHGAVDHGTRPDARGRKDFGRDRKMAHRNDGKWHEVRGLRGDGRGPHANDGRWHKRSSFGSSEKGWRPSDGEWHTE